MTDPQDPQASEIQAEEVGVRVVLVTVPDEETGRQIVGTVVEDRLAACGNLIPGLTSIYRWKGEVHQDPECLIILKTMASILPALQRRVVELHPYEVPEVLAFSPMDGHLPYLEWVRAEVEEKEGS